MTLASEAVSDPRPSGKILDASFFDRETVKVARDLLGLDLHDRRDASLAAAAYGVAHGARIVRVHDVAGTVRVCRTVEAIAAEAPVTVP